MQRNSLWKIFPLVVIISILLVPAAQSSLPGMQFNLNLTPSAIDPLALAGIFPRLIELKLFEPRLIVPRLIGQRQTEPPPSGPVDPPPSEPSDQVDPPPTDPTELPLPDATDSPPADPTDPVETSEPTEPVETPSPTEPVETDQPTEPAKTAVPSETIEPTEEIAPTASAEPTEIFAIIPPTGASQAEDGSPAALPPLGPTIAVFTLSTDSTVAGNLVIIHAVVDSARPGATRIKVSCGVLTKVETNAVQFNSTWNTRGCPTGEAVVTLLTRDVQDVEWLNPVSTRMTLYIAAELGASSPAASLSVDSEKVSQGQCTIIRWATSGASTVELDGVLISAAGEKQVCPTKTRDYTLTARGVKENVVRSVTVLVTPPAAADGLSTHFRTGDVISIRGRYFLIVEGLRHQVPNYETLSALGYDRESVNNLGLSDEELLTIAQGIDIPDREADPAMIEKLKAYLNPSQPLPATEVQPAAPAADSAAAPALPASIAPRDGSVFQEGVSLKFDWSGQSNDYLLQIVGGPYIGPIQCGWQYGTTCTVRELLAGVYAWQVKSRSTAGLESEWSKLQTFTVASGGLNLPFVPVTGSTDARQVVGTCTLFCQIRLFGVKTWNAVWGIPADLPAVVPETVDGFLANHTLHEGSLVGARKTSIDLVKRLTDLSGFDQSDDANDYLKAGGQAQPLTDIAQIKHCSSLLLYIGQQPTPTHALFVYGVNRENKMLTIIQQNSPPGRGVDAVNINFASLDLKSTYVINTKCK